MAEIQIGPLNRQRLHETIAERVEEMILNGEFQPSQALPTELEMASTLQVSRTVVRDAMRVLATKGLVEIRHGVGTIVASGTRERLAEAISLSLRRQDYTPWELYVIRRGLEMIVVEEAISHATPEQIAEMRAVLENYRRLFAMDPEAGLHEREHVHFHQLMAQATGNRVLMDLLDPITVFRIPQEPGGHVARQSLEPEEQELYWRQHERIIDAIEQRDLQAARAAMLEHLADLGVRAAAVTQGREGQS